MLAEDGQDGLVAELIGEIGVHAGRVEVAVLALERGLRIVGGPVEVNPEQIAVDAHEVR